MVMQPLQVRLVRGDTTRVAAQPFVLFGERLMLTSQCRIFQVDVVIHEYIRHTALPAVSCLAHPAGQGHYSTGLVTILYVPSA
jgi:hypothetical protein